MSIQSEISRLSGNVSDALDAVGDMGGTVPSGANSDNLAAAIRSIPQSGGGPSAGSDVEWVSCDIDLMQFQVTNLSHSYAEIVQAIEDEKVVKAKVRSPQTMSSYNYTFADLVTYSEPDANEGIEGTLSFSAFVMMDMGTGNQLFRVTFVVTDQDDISLSIQLINQAGII